MLIFDKNLEQYVDTEANKPLTRVSNLLTSVSPKFDSDYWSKKKATELNVSQQEILLRWRKINEEACAHGTMTHDELERSVELNTIESKYGLGTTMSKKDYILKLVYDGSINASVSQSCMLKYREISDRLYDYFDAGWIPFPELRLHDLHYGLAGTIDLPIFKLIDGIVYYKIIDYKTNKSKIQFSSGYYKKLMGMETDQWVTTNEKFLPPLSHIPYCKGNLYKFQLNLYGYLMETNFGFTFDGFEIFQIPKGKNVIYNFVVEQDVPNTKLLLNTLIN